MREVLHWVPLVDLVCWYKIENSYLISHANSVSAYNGTILVTPDDHPIIMVRSYTTFYVYDLLYDYRIKESLYTKLENA